MKTLAHLSLVFCLVTGTVAWSQQPLVQWGGTNDMVTGSIDLTVGKSTTALSFTSPTSPAQGPGYYPAPSGATPTFYSAVIAKQDGVDNTINNWRFDNTNPDRLFSNNNAASGFTGTNDLHHIIMWDKADYLFGAGTGAELETISFVADGNSGNTFGRFVIEVGDTDFYVSDRFDQRGSNSMEFLYTVGTNEATVTRLDGNDSPVVTSVNWFAYTPLSDFTQIGSGVTLTASDFDNVTAVGAYYGNETTGRYTQSYFTEFNATAIPEPSTLVLVAVSLVAGGACLRRRG